MISKQLLTCLFLLDVCAALRNRSRIMCRVALPNGSHRAVLVDAWTTVGDVVPEVIRQLRFQNQPKSFGLFEITPQAKNEIRLKVHSLSL